MAALCGVGRGDALADSRSAAQPCRWRGSETSAGTGAVRTASSRRIELMAGGSPRSADGSKLERDHACDQRSRIELAHNRFEAAQAARKRMQRSEVAVAHRSAPQTQIQSGDRAVWSQLRGDR